MVSIMNKYYEEKELVYPKESPENSEDQFFGNGWDVERKNGKFYLSYISGQLAGKENRIEISEDDFFDMKLGKLTFDQICRKYRVN